MREAPAGLLVEVEAGHSVLVHVDIVHHTDRAVLLFPQHLQHVNSLIVPRGRGRVVCVEVSVPSASAGDGTEQVAGVVAVEEGRLVTLPSEDLLL